MDIQVGNIVIPKPGAWLHSEGVSFPLAVVVSTEPLVFVSEDAEARWQVTIDPTHFTVMGNAPDRVMDLAMSRLNS